MTRGKVEVVRSVYEAAARHDSAAVLAAYHPEVEWDTSRPGTPGDIAGGAIYRGHDGLRSWFREWYEAWEDLVDECEELIDAGEHVISVSTMRARGRSSGVEVTSRRFFGLWTIRDGKVARVVWFPSLDEALEAARSS